MNVDFLTSILENLPFISAGFKRNEFLIEDRNLLLNIYDSEKFVDDRIPYVILNKFYKGSNSEAFSRIRKVKTTIDESKFQIQSDFNKKIHEFQVAASKAFEDKISFYESSVVRLLDCEFIEGQLTALKLQHAKYSDQVMSNLVLDWKGHNIQGITTLRDYLRAKYGNRLPPFSCEFLANTLGVSCILYYKLGNQFIPYVTQRAKYTSNFSKKSRLAIFEGKIHVTSSGAVDFPLKDNPEPTSKFWNLVRENMYRELDEEVGILKEDIEELVPLAFTRELLRAGKPQMFFGGILKSQISIKDLQDKRRKAIIKQKENKDEKIEIEDKSLRIYSMEALLKEWAIQGITLELLGNLFFSQEYIRNRTT